jgi:H+-transporting ATPase
LKSLGNIEQTDFLPFDPITKRTEGSIRDIVTGDRYKTTKGAPHVILHLTSDEEMKKKCEADVTSLAVRGIRCLAVAKTDEHDEWQLLGLLTFLDPPRHDTKVHNAMSL